MFKDRKDAGEQLGYACDKYRGKNALVLAIPRGGVEVGYYVASYLEAELSIIITRKLPLPQNQEAGFGAITEDGGIYMIEDIASTLSVNTIEKIKKEQQEEIKRRKKILRNNKPLPNIKGRSVILVDDGIAMGSTMSASVELCKKKGASHITVAAPISGPYVAREMTSIADDVIILEAPFNFRAVAQGYEMWYDVPDKEVLDVMIKVKKYGVLK